MGEQGHDYTADSAVTLKQFGFALGLMHSLPISMRTCKWSLLTGIQVHQSLLLQHTVHV